MLIQEAATMRTWNFGTKGDNNKINKKTTTTKQVNNTGIPRTRGKQNIIAAIWMKAWQRTTAGGCLRVEDVHQEQVENSKDTDGKLLTESNEVVQRSTGNCRDIYNYDDEFCHRLLQEERDTRTQVVGLHRSPEKRWTLPGAALAWGRYR